MKTEQERLLNLAGLKESDFYDIRKVEQSDFTDRITVTTGPTLQAHPYIFRDVPTFILRLSLDGEETHVFRPLQ